MSLYCLKCRRKTEDKNPEVTKTNKRGIMLLSKCALYNSQKSSFIKKHQAGTLLCSLGQKNTFK